MNKSSTTSNFFLGTLLLCFALVVASPTAQAQVIIDYYKLLADYDDDIKMHTLSEENGQWYAQATNASKKTKIQVDNKKNFLELKDKEKDGTFTLQLSLFKKSNGETLVALVKNHMDIFLHGEIHILKLRNGRWNDVTDEVMPDLTYQDFIEQTMSLAASAFNPQLNHHLEFGYQLGTSDSKATALMQTQVLKEKCDQNDPTIKEYCASLNKISYSSIELVWKAKEGKFVVGEKK